MIRIAQFFEGIIVFLTKAVVVWSLVFVAVLTACGDSATQPIVEEIEEYPNYVVSMDTATYILSSNLLGNTWGIGVQAVVTGTGFPEAKAAQFFGYAVDKPDLVRVTNSFWDRWNGWSADSRAPTTTITQQFRVESVGSGVVTMKVWHPLDPRKVTTFIMTFQK